MLSACSSGAQPVDQPGCSFDPGSANKLQTSTRYFVKDLSEFYRRCRSSMSGPVVPAPHEGRPSFMIRNNGSVTRMG